MALVFITASSSALAVCVTGNVYVNGQLVSSTTICYETPIYLPDFDTLNTSFDTIGDDGLPTFDESIGCESGGPDAFQFASAAFEQYRLLYMQEHSLGAGGFIKNHYFLESWTVEFPNGSIATYPLEDIKSHTPLGLVPSSCIMPTP